jgi:hypothetical protein
MITCFLRRQCDGDGTIDPGHEGFLRVRTESDDQIVIVMYPGNDDPCRFCSLDPDEARALAHALLAGVQLSTIEHRA